MDRPRAAELIDRGADGHVVRGHDLSGVGPDRIQGFRGRFQGDGETSPFNIMGHDYDPTNGSISAGDIVRVGGVEGNMSSHVEFINRNSGQINI